MTSFAHQNDRTASNSDANLFAIGYDYFLSKRTDIYTVVANIKNNNEAQYAPGTAGNPGGFTKAGRPRRVAPRHRFPAAGGGPPHPRRRLRASFFMSGRLCRSGKMAARTLIHRRFS